ncbi:hypothetical protein [Undibacterium sp. Ji49W]|uniref:hypothetical protein n=1 Tax=Undibacterium sp. Ji49W TaxID=3413040 RepID=UPI003BF28BC1
MLGREFSSLAIYCANLVKSNIEPDIADRELIAKYTVFCAEVTAHFNKNFIVSTFAPGYLCRTLGGNNYFVPYGLVGVFPSEQQLIALDGLICDARLNRLSAFCISGSSTFMGQTEAITDIDFCEYFSVNSNLISAINSKTKLLTSNRLLRVKFDKLIYIYPFANDVVIDEKLWDERTSTEINVKLDLIANIETLGRIAATNVVLLVDGADKGINLKRSFQYQEIVVLNDLNDIPPRSLYDPEEIGHYLNWLRGEIGNYISSATKNTSSVSADAIKALKRALSWFLMAGLKDEIVEILKIFKSSQMDIIAKFLRSKEVSRMLGNLDEENREQFGFFEAPACDPEACESFYTSILELAESLTNRIDELMGSVPILRDTA